MIAKELINSSIMPMDTRFTPLEVLSWMEEYKLSHLPVVKGKKLKGLLSESDIFNMEEPELSIDKQHAPLRYVSIFPDKHFFEVIKLMTNEQLSALPVADEAGRYMGVITTNKIMQRFASLASVQSPGGVLILEMNARDYFASQLVRLIEENDTKILGMYIETPEDSTRVKLTLKLNKTQIEPVIKTLQRFGYTIYSSWHEGDEDDLKERFDSFMNYLSI